MQELFKTYSIDQKIHETQREFELEDCMSVPLDSLGEGTEIFGLQSPKDFDSLAILLGAKLYASYLDDTASTVLGLPELIERAEEHLYRYRENQRALIAEEPAMQINSLCSFRAVILYPHVPPIINERRLLRPSGEPYSITFGGVNYDHIAKKEHLVKCVIWLQNDPDKVLIRKDIRRPNRPKELNNYPTNHQPSIRQTMNIKPHPEQRRKALK